MKAVPSPLLDRLGLLTEKDQEPPAFTGTEYCRARIRDVHHRPVLDNRERGPFEFKGVRVQNHYE
jgi:hypothetical protein